MGLRGVVDRDGREDAEGIGAHDGIGEGFAKRSQIEGHPEDQADAETAEEKAGGNAQ